MQENNFEKQVSGKMNELKLHPSATVWQNIEEAIKKQKRRRWALLFFLILFALLLSGGYWLWNSGERAHIHANLPLAADTSAKPDATTIEKEPIKNDTDPNIAKPSFTEPSNTGKDLNKKPREAYKTKPATRILYSGSIRQACPGQKIHIAVAAHQASI